MNCCFNCNAKDSIENPVESHLIEGKWLPLCDECYGEELRIESEADRLSALPSCDRRAMIIDRAETTRQLVNELRAHDLSGCPSCLRVALPEVA